MEKEKKLVKYNDWLANSSDQDEDDIDAAFSIDKFSKGNKKSHLLLQLQKTYRDDDRFKLNRDF